MSGTRSSSQQSSPPSRPTSDPLGSAGSCPTPSAAHGSATFIGRTAWPGDTTCMYSARMRVLGALSDRELNVLTWCCPLVKPSSLLDGPLRLQVVSAARQRLNSPQHPARCSSGAADAQPPLNTGGGGGSGCICSACAVLASTCPDGPICAHSTLGYGSVTVRLHPI